MNNNPIFNEPFILNLSSEAKLLLIKALCKLAISNFSHTILIDSFIVINSIVNNLERDTVNLGDYWRTLPTSKRTKWVRILVYIKNSQNLAETLTYQRGSRVINLLTEHEYELLKQLIL
jgi:hypothetical protein